MPEFCFLFFRLNNNVASHFKRISQPTVLRIKCCVQIRSKDTCLLRIYYHIQERDDVGFDVTSKDEDYDQILAYFVEKKSKHLLTHWMWV